MDPHLHVFMSDQSLQTNVISEFLVKTLKRDYLEMTQVQDSQNVLGLIGDQIEDHNETHPHLGAKNAFALRAHRS